MRMPLQRQAIDDIAVSVIALISVILIFNSDS
jgi:hypothetical protein